MPEFRLSADHGPVSLFQPEGGADSFLVNPGESIKVPGELVTSRPAPKDDEPEPAPLPDDAYIVRNNGEEKAWPHLLWELVKPEVKQPAKAEPVKEK